MSSRKKSGGKASRRAQLAIRVPAATPRNPVVIAPIRREASQGAGRHQSSGKAERRAQKVALKKLPPE